MFKGNGYIEIRNIPIKLDELELLLFCKTKSRKQNKIIVSIRSFNYYLIRESNIMNKSYNIHNWKISELTDKMVIENE